MKKYFLIIIITIIAFEAKSQQTPFWLAPGQTQTLSPNSDTLWVLNNKQYKKAIAFAEDDKLCTEQVSLLKKEIGLYKQRSGSTDSLKTIFTKDRDYYKQHFDTCEKDLQTLGGKLNRRSFFLKIAIIAIPVAFLAGKFL